MKKQTLALACLVAGTLAACGGGSSPSTQSPSFAATTGSVSGTSAVSAVTRWGSVKFGGGGYVPFIPLYHYYYGGWGGYGGYGGVYRGGYGGGPMWP